MKKGSWFPVFYMFVVTALLSSVVIGLTFATQDRVEANEAFKVERAVLNVLPGMYDPNLSNVQLHERYVEDVIKPSDATGGAWAIGAGRAITAYAVPVAGKGFWAPIRGVIGVKNDGRTITDVVFYEQNETPGLGAQITTKEFRSQFVGKTLSADEKPLEIVRPGSKLGPSEVHAVTGATQTSVRLEKIINDGVNEWRRSLGKDG